MTKTAARALTITADLFEERECGTYWLGDLVLGKGLAGSDRYVYEYLDYDGAYRVLLCDAPDPDDVAEWGTSEGGDPEEAWRYALGALIGPFDYDQPQITIEWIEEEA